MRTVHLAPLFIVVALCSGDPTGALAQNGQPLITDRPDFTESAVTVAPGRFQLETGYTFSRRDESKEHSLGEVLVRIGVLGAAELRLGLNSFAFLEDSEGDERGFQDVFLGAKIALAEARPSFNLLSPGVALLIGSSVPIGSEGIGERDPIPEAKLALGWDLNETFSLGSNLNVALASAEGESFSQFSGSLALGVGLTEELGGYLEVFGFAPSHPRGPDLSFLNGGVTVLATPDLQFDARVGVGFNESEPDYFVGFGFALRF